MNKDKPKDGGTEKNRVLSDHLRVGKRFIPRWCQLPLREVKWVDCLLPELLWLGLLNDCFGLREGARLSLSLAQAAVKANVDSQGIWYAPASAYALLDDVQKNQVKESLKLSGDLDLISKGLAPLAAFYPECPLSFVFEGLSADVGPSKGGLEQLKEFLSALFDKRQKPAIFMQADAIYIAFVTNLLTVSPSVALANFPAVAEYPATEESRRVGASVCAAVNGLFGNYYKGSSPWPRYFWNRGLELEPCDHQEVEGFVSNPEDTRDHILSIVDNYVRRVRIELSERWGKWSIDLAKSEMQEVIGALLARQVTLATQLALSPSVWNGHVAPLILRSMAETFITLSWIFGDPVDRSRKFILYGLGQEKLYIEHLKTQSEDPDDDIAEYIEQAELWLNSQRYSFLTEVNIGSWSGIDIRKMAEQSDCLDLYRFAYTPFSAATHSMWHHVGKYNLVICRNPLHGYHGIPTDRRLPSDMGYLYQGADYVEKTFTLFDEKTSVESDVPSAFETLVQSISNLTGPDTPDAEPVNVAATRDKSR